MDFARIIELVGGFLDRRDCRWAVCGGLGLGAYGLARTTLDADFVVESAVQEDLVAFLASSGFATLYRSQGFSNHLHPDPALGRVDCVYVRGKTAADLFAATREVDGPPGRRVRVPKPEHLAAMKVAAMASDPSRTLQDLADIQFLLRLPGVDREEATATSSATDWKGGSMSSSPRCDLLGLEAGLVVTAEDVLALKRLRAHATRSLLDRLDGLAPTWPAPPDPTARPTAAGPRPVEL